MNTAGAERTCMDCDAPAAPGRVRCAVHLAEAAARVRRAQRARIEAGVCVQCSRPAVEGRVRCEEHLVASRAATRVAREADPGAVRESQKKSYRKHKASGLCLHCKEPRAAGRSFCERHLEYGRQKARARYRAGTDGERRRRWRANTHEGATKYGITREEHERMVVAQGHRCAICGAKDAGGKRGFHVDHDHRFKLGDRRGVRGIVCQNCNTALGRFGDDLAGLRRALEYLEKFEERVRPRLVGSV